MPSAAIPTVRPGASLVPASFRHMTGLPSALRRMGRKLGDAWFREPPRSSTQDSPKVTRLQRAELGAMSAHDLNDLGIGRSEIPALMGEPSAWRSSRY